MKKLLFVIFTVLITLSLSVFAYAAEDGGAVGTAADENVFSIVYSWLSVNAGQIFSALTLISSFVLAFTYKRGLLPKLSGALSKIGGAVGSIGKSTETALSTLGDDYTKITEGISLVSGLCEGLADELSAITARLDEGEREKGEIEKMKIILSSQVDLLYEIFLSSALPQYAKEAVAQKVNEMRRTLNGGVAEE